MATPYRYEGYINQRLARLIEDTNSVSNAGTMPVVQDAYGYIFNPQTWTYSIEKRTPLKFRERKALKDFL